MLPLSRLSFAIRVSTLLAIALFLPHLNAEITLVDVPPNPDFPNALAAKALRHACTADASELPHYFASRRLQYRAELVRAIAGRSCHIYYEPTLRGFRAHPESTPVHGLFLDLEHVALLSRRSMEFGDNFDMARSILANLPRRLDVTLSVPLRVKREHYATALEHSFPGVANQMWLRDRPLATHQAWAQDYLKSGDVHGETRVLLPRLAFEGRTEYGKAYKQLLETFSEPAWVRSRLSWDGGDLMTVADPRNPSRLVLLYGDAARPYWGSSLTDGEYGYVLASEFGADEARHFGGLAPHIDYFVSILPVDKIALVAQPLQEDFEISRAAIELLAGTFSNPVPDVITQLRSIYATRQSAFVDNVAAARRLIEQARRESASWATPVRGDVYQRLEAHTAKHCRGNPSACLEGSKLAKLMDEDPALLRDWADVTALLRTTAKLPTAMLSVLESQLPGAVTPSQLLIEEKIRELQQMGFRVIRVPRIGGEASSQAPWAGISYVNAALIDDTLFVPVFGLGAQEGKFLSLLQNHLPAHYTVVPVFARYAQLYNGGAHCILAFFRDPSAHLVTGVDPNTPPDGGDSAPRVPIPAPKVHSDQR